MSYDEGAPPFDGTRRESSEGYSANNFNRCCFIMIYSNIDVQGTCLAIGERDIERPATAAPQHIQMCGDERCSGNGEDDEADCTAGGNVRRETVIRIIKIKI